MLISKITALLILFFFAVSTTPVWSDVQQIKNYKEAFPGESPKCLVCHVDKIPKKEDGQHELNDYGKKVKKENDKPTADTYKKVGKPDSGK